MNRKLTITDEELYAIRDIVDYNIDQECKDCAQWLFEQTGGEIDDCDDADIEGHIYGKLKIVQKMLDKLKL